MLFTARNPISEDDIIKCMYLINKIKKHRHNKIKRKQLDRFNCLVNKSSEYLYNISSFGRCIPLDGYPPNTANTHPHHSSSGTITLASHSSSTYCTHNIHSTQYNGTLKHQTKVGHKPFQHPLTSAQESLLARGPNLATTQKYPQGGLCCSSCEGLFQTPSQGGR